MKKISLLLFFSGLILVNCKVILTKMYGIKDPEIENKKTIQKKALKFGLDTSNLVTVNSVDFLSVLKQSRGIPECAVFNKKGEYIEYKKSDTSCNAGVFNFISELDATKNYTASPERLLKKDLEKFRDLNGKTLAPDYVKAADFYVLMYWCVYAGKLNKDHVKVWEQNAKNNTKAKIQVIKVNLDFQEYWDKNETKRIIDRMNKK